MIRLRCSQLPLLFACPSSKRQWKYPVDEDTPEAKLGREVHRGLAGFIRGETTVLSIEATKLVMRGKHIWKTLWGNIPNPEAEYECGFLEGAWRLTGHMDIAAPPAVWDWKSGWAETDYLPQLRGYAECLARERLEGVIEGHVVWLRTSTIDTFFFFVSAKERAEWISRGHDPNYCIDNSRFAEEVTELVADIGKRYSPGEHCWRCPGRNECPVKESWAHGIVGSLVPLNANLPFTRAELSRAWTLWKQLEKLGRDLKRVVEASVAEGGPLAGPDGNQWAFDEVTLRPILTRKAMPLLLQSLSEDDILDCVEISKKALSALVKATAPRGQKGRAWKSLLDSLEAGGALDEKTVRTLKLKRRMEDDSGNSASNNG